MRNILLKAEAWKDIAKCASEDPKLVKKIFDLISNSLDTPFEGLGKPEPLRGDLKGYWSRRITQEHRLVYKVETDTIIIISAYGHY